ncbi:hypothetical protein TPHA_0E01950 [Tetrapisispora phaffii CBS 4417]|uniref:Manganese/iron superoxide dismutase C-terminal domain-containing protein n=1 Tax=Tetrapisispora phaffii (strain ATCC 24235 / CBS 4417 / NBRC 1672 / NRRL Y-8282 / UCD 70-5) TaxID=1071381 RepID=G8BTQ9_TETPH|nr:hypothetical protein TPHA_0E01950 [Tetrapisispora phaffii CBS 4417]CCE63287.1 hypothetical protein TPHA_0E01950 [Tetrapisispora phaffii CBS 4417]
MSYILVTKKIVSSLIRAHVITRSYITPSLDHLNEKDGLPGLYSSQGLRNAWYERVQHHTDELNKFVDENTDERPILQLINDHSKSFTKRNLVKNAAMIHNLTFANNSLTASNVNFDYQLPLANKKTTLIKDSVDIKLNYKNEPDKITYKKLYPAILSSFGSMVEFRTLLLNSNLGISGDGFTWLVARKHQAYDYSMESSNYSEVKFDRLFVVNTYNAGTPFNFNKSNQMTELKLFQEKELKTQQTEEQIEELAKKDENKEKDINDVLEAHSYDKNVSYIPLLAIDASPKCWLHDYGVFGKEQYLNNVWESINWDVVESRMPELSQQYKVVI